MENLIFLCHLDKCEQYKAVCSDDTVVTQAEEKGVFGSWVIKDAVTGEMGHFSEMWWGHLGQDKRKWEDSKWKPHRQEAAVRVQVVVFPAFLSDR